MVRLAQTVSLFRTPASCGDVLLQWQINNTYMIKYPSYTCMLAEEIALGMRVRYPRTGTTGKILRTRQVKGETFAELDMYQSPVPHRPAGSGTWLGKNSSRHHRGCKKSHRPRTGICCRKRTAGCTEKHRPEHVKAGVNPPDRSFLKTSPQFIPHIEQLLIRPE